MLDLNNLVNSLHPLERKVFPLLSKYSSVDDLCKVCGLKNIEVVRALQWLQNKKLVVIDEKLFEFASLDDNGRDFVVNGLPERKFLNSLKNGSLKLSNIEKSAGLKSDEVNICVGVLKSKNFINLKNDNGVFVSLTELGETFLGKDFVEEIFLKKKFPLDLSSLSVDDKKNFDVLLKRKKILVVELKRVLSSRLTELGKQVCKIKISGKEIVDKIDSSIIKSGDWSGKSFRRFDVSINVPKVFVGKFQHYRKFLDSVRNKFMSLGFSEMTGPLVENDFWDMDALYMPQFHSARDIHEAYYIKEPKFQDVESSVLNKVKEVHEYGGNTGSRGWCYSFDFERTKRTLLRTQGTACSSRMLASKNLKIPGKYFGITRCFRHDVIDATHLSDFNQTEGIVIEEGLTLKHLFGLLKMFAKEFAETDQIKIVPGYFPFTEPSAELFAKHPKLGWVELGGAGIFRPEVVTPLLGKHVSVLAWGIGIDRLAMFKLGINDIRQLFSHDLAVLRNSRVV